MLTEKKHIMIKERCDNIRETLKDIECIYDMILYESLENIDNSLIWKDIIESNNRLMEAMKKDTECINTLLSYIEHTNDFTKSAIYDRHNIKESEGE